MWETEVWSLGQEDPLEKRMAIHSTSLAWRIPQTEEPGTLQSTGSQGAGHDWANNTHLFWCFSYYKSTKMKINNSSTIKLSFWSQMIKRLPAIWETQVWSLVRKILWRRKWQPTTVLLPGQSHGQRSLVGYSPWDHRVEHDWTTSLSLFAFICLKHQALCQSLGIQ